MASIKNLPSIAMELPKNFSWPLSRTRTQAFLGSLAVLVLFFYLSAIFAENSPAPTTALLSSRLFRISNYIPSFSSISSSDIHLVSNSSENYTNVAVLSVVTPVETTHIDSVVTPVEKIHIDSVVIPVEETYIDSRKTETDVIGELASCDFFDGDWIVDDSKPMFQLGSCPFLDDAFNCFKNGRPDSDYLRFRWQPRGCRIPRFDGKAMLEMLRGKRLAFVGDSLNRNMWESLVCLLRDSLVDKSRVIEISGKREFRTQGFYSFRFIDYNCTIEFVRSLFLVQEWKISNKTGVQEDTLRLDLIQEASASTYRDADIIIFNTGHHWTHPKTHGGKDFYQEGDHVYSQLDWTEAFRKAMQTWAKWVDANLDLSRTTVLFRGYSASHFSGGQWNSGGSCNGETKPITNTSHLQPNPQIMSILESVLTEMKTPVFYLNVTRMTDYRKDAHPSIFRGTTAQNRHGWYQDCSHWCLPGVPDDWNELLYASLLIARHNSLNNHHS